ncbi:hypothetical protein Tco_0572823 [Tanacetum coccineum]
MAFVSSPSSTNEVNTTNIQVSTANSPVSTADTPDSTANLKMDLKWQLALLSMRARRYFQRTGKKITINGSDTAGYDKNQDSSRRTVNVEETSSKAMVAIDGAGFDWSFMADEEVPTMEGNQRSRSIAWRTNKIEGLGLEMGGASKRLEGIAPDFEDSRARGFVHRPLDLQSLACLIYGNPIS